MTTTISQVQVRQLDASDTAALYHRYPRELNPQPCFVALDLESGKLRADWDGEVGGAVPMRVWHGVVRRYTIPCLRAEAANLLLDAIAPLAQRILADAQVVWDGSNHVARLGDEARLAENEIERLCEGAADEPSDLVAAWDAADYYAGLSRSTVLDTLGLTAASTDEELKEIARREQAEARSNNVDVLEGLEEYIEKLRDELREEED